MENALINEVSQHPALTIDANANVATASRLMHEMKIHHLPVTDEHGFLKGILSSYDVLSIFDSNGEGDVKVEDLMTQDPLVFLSKNDDLKRAIMLFKEFNISSIPITEDGKVKGIVTIKDLLQFIDSNLM